MGYIHMCFLTGCHIAASDFSKVVFEIVHFLIYWSIAKIALDLSSTTVLAMCPRKVCFLFCFERYFGNEIWFLGLCR